MDDSITVDIQIVAIFQITISITRIAVSIVII